MLTDDVLVLYRGEVEFDDYGFIPAAVVRDLLDHIDYQAVLIRELEVTVAALRAEPPGPPVTDPDRSPQNREAGGW